RGIALARRRLGRQRACAGAEAAGCGAYVGAAVGRPGAAAGRARPGEELPGLLSRGERRRGV
ncbi:hypothetical protein LPJ57_005384, partial [Coemansia sp. RSA 486]